MDLRDSGRVWLNLDHAQQGLGSASCGPALPEPYRVPVEPTTFGIRHAATTNSDPPQRGARIVPTTTESADDPPTHRHSTGVEPLDYVYSVETQLRTS